MPNSEMVTTNLYGMYRDVLRDAQGRLIWDRGWQRNTIVTDCRRLLASLVRQEPEAAGIQGLQFGEGLSSWDETGPPPANSSQWKLEKLVHTLDWDVLEFKYLDRNGDPDPSTDPTNRLQIKAELGENVPSDKAITLREFGLVGKLGDQALLMNYVTHLAIVKDPSSTLQRTIWLVF